jgi:3-hydroxyacyl-CoA dehydrogenase
MADARPLVGIERSGDVALLIIDHPPVNLLSAALREQLAAAVGQVVADARVRAAVLVGAGRTFVAGADIREFEAPPSAVTTDLLAAAIENAGKPFVAALHGTALGAGFELALACHARVMAPDAFVGLPECRLGLIPGGGGTQRTPRLAGAMAALDLVTSGRQVPAHEALRLGLVDEIATDLRRRAVERARDMAVRRTLPRSSARPIADMATPEARAGFEAAVAAAVRRARGALAPAAAAEAIRWAIDLPFAEAMAREKAASLELRQGPQSRALRYLFHARRAAARLPSADGVEVRRRPVQLCGVVGGGVMGAGIAVALADAGLEVTLVEVSAEAAAAAEARVRQLYAHRVGGGRLVTDAVERPLGRIRFSAALGAVAEAALVIEAVPEDLALKLDIFRRLSGVVRRDCLLASNTSYLDIDLMADVVDAPERVLGLHFFSPVEAMKLVEIVRGGRTSPETEATALALARRIGKIGVLVGVCEGFVGNRIFTRAREQCDFLLEEGAMPGQVDAALEAYGFAMGPYAVTDLTGLDIGWATRRRLAPRRDRRARTVAIADWLCELGRFGQKSGAGYYRYPGGRRETDPAVAELVLRASAERGIARREVGADEIVERVLTAMINEAARVVAEGVARRSSDVDVVMVDGYGFPAWRGGPMYQAELIGPAEVLRRVEAMAARDGVGWEPAPLLVEMAAKR